MIPKPPAPPPSIANVTPALPPPKAKPSAPPPPKAKPAAQPRRNAKPKQALALQDQGRPHHEEAPASKTTKTKLQTASVSGDPSKGEMEVDAESWNKMTLQEIQHRLAIRGFRKSYNPDGTRMIKAD